VAIFLRERQHVTMDWLTEEEGGKNGQKEGDGGFGKRTQSAQLM
jgi:hypothetical protein